MESLPRHENQELSPAKKWARSVLLGASLLFASFVPKEAPAQDNRVFENSHDKYENTYVDTDGSRFSEVSVENFDPKPSGSVKLEGQYLKAVETFSTTVTISPDVKYLDEETFSVLRNNLALLDGKKITPREALVASLNAATFLIERLHDDTLTQEEKSNAKSILADSAMKYLKEKHPNELGGTISFVQFFASGENTQLYDLILQAVDENGDGNTDRLLVTRANLPEGLDTALVAADRAVVEYEKLAEAGVPSANDMRVILSKALTEMRNEATNIEGRRVILDRLLERVSEYKKVSI